MADRKALGIVEHENLFLCDLNEDKLPNLIFKDDIEHWNRHDYKNVIAFKDWESFSVIGLMHYMVLLNFIFTWDK